jgi:CRP-like cAMP-binding protein
MTNAQKDTLAAEMIMSHHRSGEVIFSQGDDANALFVVKKGIVDVIKDYETIASVAEGAFFGENALLESNKAKRSATIAARTDVVCLSLPRQLLMEIFGQDVQSISLTNFARAALRKSPVLSKFTRTQQERLINGMKITSIEAGENLFEKERDYFKIILMLEGKLSIVKDVGVCNFLRILPKPMK